MSDQPAATVSTSEAPAAAAPAPASDIMSAAERRRQKILARSGERMKVVGGEFFDEQSAPRIVRKANEDEQSILPSSASASSSSSPVADSVTISSASTTPATQPVSTPVSTPVVTPVTPVTPAASIATSKPNVTSTATTTAPKLSPIQLHLKLNALNAQQKRTHIIMTVVVAFIISIITKLQLLPETYFFIHSPTITLITLDIAIFGLFYTRRQALLAQAPQETLSSLFQLEAQEASDQSKSNSLFSGSLPDQIAQYAEYFEYAFRGLGAFQDVVQHTLIFVCLYVLVLSF